MFGYLKPESNAICNKLYKTYYCSLCHSLWNNYGFISRFLLSYDMTFICILLGLNHMEPEHSRVTCYKKMKPNDMNGNWKKIAAISLMMVEEKLNDDIKDEKSLKARAIKLLYRNRFKKARMDYPTIASKLSEGFSDFSEKEKTNSDVYELSNSFSSLMISTINEGFYCSSEENSIIKYVSKWVYFIDAVDDLDKDIKKKRFNPFIFIASSKRDLLTNNSTYIENYLLSLADECNIHSNFFDLSKASNYLLASVLCKMLPHLSYCVFTDSPVKKRGLLMKLAERRGIYYA